MATPIFSCGFECGVSGSHWTLPGAGSFSTTTVRSGTRSLRFNSVADFPTATLSFAIGSTLVRVMRVYVRFAVLPSANMVVLAGNLVSGPTVRFKQSDASLYAAVGTGLAASGYAITTNRWYLIDWLMQIDTAGPDTSTVAVDGTTLAVASGAGAGTAATNVRIGGDDSWTGDLFVDDVLISHTLADYPLGAGYVNHFVPTSDGAHNVAGTADFRKTLTATDILNSTTDAYQLVDDVPLESGASVDWINMLAPVNATDYVECVFGPAPGISAPTTPPRAVEVIAGIHHAATTTGNMEIRLNDNGTMGTVYTATAVAGVTSVAYKRAHFADPPSAATAWVIGGGGNGDFTDLRVRFGSPAVLDVVPDQYFDCIMLEAEFATVSAAPYPYLPRRERRNFWNHLKGR